ncbi:MAG: cobalamin biosynthesis protein CobD [Lachnospiraceae bacterium]|nr:cobalamin biosynthesis protein CobD [Lachnospiraceae bacterium]
MFTENMFKTIFEFHIIAFALGFFLDLLIGDPHWLYHPVRLIGLLISVLEKIFLKNKKKFFWGIMTVIIVLLSTFVLTGILIAGTYFINRYLGLVTEAIMTYFILATKSLKYESMKVYRALKDGSLEDGRKAVSMIVGRDTKNLCEEGVIKAAVETVAENTSDGVIAPMIFTAIGGPVLGFLYKAVNTMDSMIGYKNDKYIHFGRAAAKLDDFVNFLPSRISAVLMIAASALGGRDFDAKNAHKIFKRDRFNHASPNSAQTESVCAGALGVKLAGDASYFGKIVKKPFIGDDTRSIEKDDIKRACRLMYITAFECMFICIAVLAEIYLVAFFLLPN